MFGNATLEIPAGRNIGPSKTTGMSDNLAMSYGRLAAMTLSEYDQGFVIVTLSNGTVKVIGRDVVTNEVHIGRLVPDQRE